MNNRKFWLGVGTVSFGLCVIWFGLKLRVRAQQSQIQVVENPVVEPVADKEDIPEKVELTEGNGNQNNNTEDLQDKNNNQETKNENGDNGKPATKEVELTKEEIDEAKVAKENYQNVLKAVKTGENKDFQNLTFPINSDFKEMNLSGFDFSGSKLDGSMWNESILKGSRFNGSDLEGAIFTDAVFGVGGAEFNNGADIKKADFSYSKGRVSLEVFSLSHSDNTKVRGANFKKAGCLNDWTESLIDRLRDLEVVGLPKKIITKTAKEYKYEEEEEEEDEEDEEDDE
jgi:uncharacterized protein YjbI with pentapeptide repeats